MLDTPGMLPMSACVRVPFFFLWKVLPVVCLFVVVVHRAVSYWVLTSINALWGYFDGTVVLYICLQNVGSLWYLDWHGERLPELLSKDEFLVHL
jgi:hypothetical protein